MGMMVKKTAIIGVAVTRVQKIEFTNFRVRRVIGGNEVNLGFNSTVHALRDRGMPLLHMC